VEGRECNLRRFDKWKEKRKKERRIRIKKREWIFSSKKERTDELKGKLGERVGGSRELQVE
jgi:hypothetical protein